MTWRWWTIDGRDYYTPTLPLAFDAARARTPWRHQWTCTGSREAA